MTVARATKNIGFTIPPGMADEFELVAAEEGSTKSELFRRMFRVYRTYRKELAKAEAERIAKIVADVLEDAKRPMEEGALNRLDDEVRRYGSAQAKRMGITEKDVDRIVYDYRKRKSVRAAKA